MNTFKTSLLILTLGLGVASCAADGNDQTQLAVPAYQTVYATCPTTCPEACAQEFQAKIDAVMHNPAYKIGEGIEKLAQLPAQIREEIAQRVRSFDGSYRQHLIDSPYKTVGRTLGAFVIGSTLGLMALVAIAQEMNNRRYVAYWKKYDQEQAERQAEEKRWQEQEDHNWVQQKKHEEEQATHFEGPLMPGNCGCYWR